METGLLTILGLLIIAAGIQFGKQSIEQSAPCLMLFGICFAVLGVALIIVAKQENNNIK